MPTTWCRWSADLQSSPTTSVVEAIRTTRPFLQFSRSTTLYRRGEIAPGQLSWPASCWQLYKKRTRSQAFYFLGELSTSEVRFFSSHPKWQHPVVLLVIIVTKASHFFLLCSVLIFFCLVSSEREYLVKVLFRSKKLQNSIINCNLTVLSLSHNIFFRGAGSEAVAAKGYYIFFNLHQLNIP